MTHFLRTSIIVSVSVLAAASGCRKPTDAIEAEQEIVDSIPSTNPNPEQSQDPVFLKRYVDIGPVTGEISKVPKDSPLLPWLQKDAAPYNGGKLNLIGRTAPMLVFGDGMAAGWTDGGLYRAGQQTAFPNLVAHQMGLKNFKSPLFDLEHGNGTGYLVLNNHNGQPSWSEVSNNLAILKRTNMPELAPYLGGDVENMSEPKVDQAGISGLLSPKENGWIYGNGRGWTDDMIFFWRMKPSADKYKDSYLDMLNMSLASKKPAIVLSSFGFDFWSEQNVKNEGQRLDWATSTSETSALTVIVAELAERSGATGVVYTLPAFKHLPYFYWQTQFSAPFGPERLDFGTPTATNKRIRQEAKEKKLLVVDLESLYAKIYAGNYVTEDGYKISGKPGGNFFSNDGMYPSAIGNAVIANETIKVINAHFSSQIPLIHVKEFASYLK